MQPSAYKKYFDSYCEPINKIYDKIQDYAKKSNWNNVTVVPAYNELHHLELTLETLNNAAKHANHNGLVIIVVNSKVNSNKEAVTNNDQTLKYWKQKVKKHTSIENSQGFIGHWENLDLLFIDRNSKKLQFTEKQGVGLARKIGADLAAFLFYKKLLQSEWIYNTDADVEAPLDYYEIQTIKPHERYSALVVPFVHICNKEQIPHQAQAIKLYDSYLQYYVNGLKIAGSPYTYHTIGSTIIINIDTYIRVRGFPQKQAGEDFYLLNKVSKLNPITEKKGNPLKLSARISSRTPFGTGQSIQKISEQLENKEKYKVYHPNSFLFLQKVLKSAEKKLDKSNTFSYLSFRQEIEVQCKQLISGQHISEILSAFNFEKHLNDISQKSPSLQSRIKHFHHWFDAFKTLKFIHLTRDLALAPIELEKAITALKV